MFNLNKIGVIWTTAFIAWNLAFILDGKGLIVHGVCMIGQTLLLFLFMWLIVKQKQHEIFMEEWRKELEEYRDGLA